MNNDDYIAIEDLLGVPYLTGGSDPMLGFDCSGLIKYLHPQHPLITGSAASIKESLPSTYYYQLKKGDLVFFILNKSHIDHVAMVVETAPNYTLIIHATNAGVVKDTLESPYYLNRNAGFAKIPNFINIAE
ncbi:MAG: C40 family peptidase [Cyclobacteriaceae bacterium]|nr:C40 family peptidase [Cyclobacteriaceae bacterium]MCH8515949.1 C40 family peptidase [Cyclobacteriaceae bacterium]